MWAIAASVSSAVSAEMAWECRSMLKTQTVLGAEAMALWVWFGLGFFIWTWY